MKSENIETKIREKVLNNLLAPQEVPRQGDDTNLIHILDSLNLLRMVAAIEKLFSIEIQNDELTDQNLGSLEKLAIFVTGKLTRGQQNARELH
jgi:acyl carrier protein